MSECLGGAVLLSRSWQAAVMAQVLGLLPPSGETWIELLALALACLAPFIVSFRKQSVDARACAGRLPIRLSTHTLLSNK